MTVYVDALFLVNFFMDLMVLSISGILGAVKFKLSRRLGASVVGAALGVLCFIFGSRYMLAAAVIIPPLIIASATFPCSKNIFFRCLLLYYASAFLLSGALTFLFPSFGLDGSFRAPILYLIAGIIFLIVKNTCTLIKSRMNMGDYKITITYREKTITTSAVLDTGNTLYDPLSGRPVIVAGESILGELFSPHCNIANITEWLDPLDLKMIPYKTIDGEGIMPGFLPHKVRIDGRVITDVIIALTPKMSDGPILLCSSII